MNETRIKERFRERFGRDCQAAARAPGRVNLIGEHTDYNDGFVLPIATQQHIIVAGAQRDDDRVCVRSETLGSEASWPADDWNPGSHPHWTSFVAGVVALLRERGAHLGGCDLLIAGDVPVGGGLASSAALEVACALALAHIAGEPLETTELIDLCRTAEHRFAGVPCGIMDQSVVLLAKADTALLLDCRTRTYEHIPFKPRGACVLIVDSGVRHELARSEYARRQSECAQAVEYFRRLRLDVAALRDVSSSTARGHASQMDPLLAARALHVTSEIERTREAAEALRRGDLPEFGRLLAASHRSLRDDYEVSCPEVDRIVEVLSACPGVFGARLTGGGFGGCVVALVENNALPRAAAAVARLADESGTPPTTATVASAAEGAALVSV